jgi:effector-binding domain-containing protein
LSVACNVASFEAADMPHGRYEITEVAVSPRLVAGVRARVARGRVAQEFGQHLNLVYSAARDGLIALDGQNIFIYREATASELVVDFCVGAKQPFVAVGAVEPYTTPSGVAVMTTHCGDYRLLGDANAAIIAWCEAHGRRRAGPSWEVYGHWHADPALLRTDVYWLLHVNSDPATP